MTQTAGKNSNSALALACVTGLTILAAGYFYFDKAPPPSGSTALREGLGNSETETIVTEDRTKGAKDPATPSAGLQKQKILASEKIGLKSMPLKKDGSTLRIPVRIIPQKTWCKSGELDTIRKASRDINKNTLLLSIEPLAGNSGSSLRTSLTNLQSGLDHVFRIDKSPDEKIFGLYICSDEYREGHCKGKALQSHLQINESLAAGGQDRIHKDYIFYFQPLIVLDDSLQVFQSNRLHKRRVNKILGENFAVSDQDMKLVWKTLIISRSLPAEINDQQLILKLPYNDPKCLLTGRKKRE